MAGLTFSDLLGVLGHESFTSVCHKPPGGQFWSDVVPSYAAPDYVHPEQDAWFGVNPLTHIPEEGRGTAADVARLAAVYADLDVKPSGMPDMLKASEVVADLGVMLGTMPSAMVMSGHGLQPYWPIEDGPSGADAQALLRRWGRLVAHVAEIRGGKVDPVYDLARVLRVPGTTNYKSEPVPVVGVAQEGRPLTAEELDDALTAYGVVELPGDRDTPGQRVVSDPGSWAWAAQTCHYVVAMMDAWATDEPAARHPWLMAQATRIAVAHRNGCFDEAGYHGAIGVLVNRFRTLVARGTEARNEAPGEISDALAWGRDLAGSMSDEQVAAELGRHRHEALGTLTFDATGRPDSPFSPSESASQDGSSDPTFQSDVRYAVRKLWIAHEAKQVFTAERAAQLEIPPFDAGSLGEILQRPAEPPYRIEGLIPNEASTLIVAMRKTGKTTLNLNLARSLIFGEPFLGKFEVRPIAGNVALLNYEVSARQIAAWADEVGIPHDRLHIVNLRGRRNPLGNDEDKAELTQWLREREVESLLVDPFGRAYTGQSQNDSGEVGAWLAELDRWARGDVGVTDLALAVHAGWEGERSRGASALEDWGDSIITLTRRKASELEEDEDGAHRYLRAEGRDVDVDEDRLEYDPVSRLLYLTGSGGRRKASANLRAEKLIPVVVEYVNNNPGCSQRDMKKDLGARHDDVRKAAEMADFRGLIRRTATGTGFTHMPSSTLSLSPGKRGESRDSVAFRDLGESGLTLSQDMDNKSNLVPLFQAGNEVSPSESQVSPGLTPAGGSPAYIYAGPAGRAIGTHNQPCPNPAHTPTKKGGRWACSDCDRESGNAV